MIALISPAKTMRSVSLHEVSGCTEPRFMTHTNHLVALMQAYSVAELEEAFKISRSLADDLKSRFAHFLYDTDSALAAVDAYDGVVYKHFKDAEIFRKAERSYLQQSVRISSLLYGLLRPFDLIRPYRMEGFIRLADSDQRVDRYWRDVQTQTLIDDVQESGGVLLYIASKEEQNAFYWSKVKKAVRVIDFKFLQYKGGKSRQVIVYTKMARGEMVRYMIQNRIDNPEQLKQFEWGGYKYDPSLSTDDMWVWLMQ